jgi:hypothetical protein
MQDELSSAPRGREDSNVSRAFVWLPIPADQELQQFAFEICNNVGSAFFGEARMLPFARNEKAPPGFDGKTAQWGELGHEADDRLMILGHGMGRLVTQLNTDNIGWKPGEKGVKLNSDDLVMWKYDKLAEVIRGNLDAGQRSRPITHQLLVCYGANKFLGKSAFGAKLASSMGSLGLRGNVWAYKGGVVLAGGLPLLATHGTSRISSRIPYTDANLNELKKAITVDENGAVSLDRNNYYDASTQREIYPIG